MKGEVRDILVGMKEHLSKGWIQGRVQNRKGVCLFGAAVKAGGLAPHPIVSDGCVKGRTGVEGVWSYGFTIESDSVVKEALDLISEEVGVTYGSLALWNDHPGRTVDEVVAVIDSLLLEDLPLAVREVHEEEVVLA